MNDSKIKSPYRGLDRRAARSEPAAPADGDALYGNLLKRTRIGGRHAAITTDLYSWHSYKSWADKMRGSWSDKK